MTPDTLGPGDHLHAALKRRFGAKIVAACRCKAWIRKMNAWGPAGCRQRIRLIVGHLRRQARKRRWWKLAALVPGANLGLRMLVMEAINQAELERAIEKGPTDD